MVNKDKFYSRREKDFATITSLSYLDDMAREEDLTALPTKRRKATISKNNMILQPYSDYSAEKIKEKSANHKQKHSKTHKKYCPICETTDIKAIVCRCDANDVYYGCKICKSIWATSIEVKEITILKYKGVKR